MKTVQYQRSSGIPSELLFDQQPLEQNVRIQSLFHLEPKAVHDDKGDQGADLPQFPEVEYAYSKEVPANRGEAQFWALFFRFYIADLREDALIGGLFVIFM